MVKTAKRRSPVPPVHFFKVVLPSVMETKILRFPPKFAQNYQSELPSMVTLSDPSGREWVVRVKKNKTGVWFGDGWFEFVEYHSIREGYFLVFRYQRKSRFEVRIFDMTACEIDYHYCCLEINDDDEIRDETNGNRRRSSKRISVGRWSNSGSVKKNVDSVKSLVEDIDEVIEVSEPCDLDVSLRKKRKRFGNTGQATVRERHQIKKGKFANANDAVEVSEADEEEREICISQKLSKKISLRRVKKLKLKHPSFIALLKRHNLVNSLVYVPTKFAARYLKNPMEFINIQDPGGRKWRVVVKVERRRYLRLSKGWGEISDANSLKEGNICVFELIKMNGNTELKLFVVRS